MELGARRGRTLARLGFSPCLAGGQRFNGRENRACTAVPERAQNSLVPLKGVT
jgi:hypothetical protein